MENKEVHKVAHSIVAQIRDLLADMPDTVPVKSFETHTYKAINETSFRVELQISDKSTLSLYLVRPS